MNHCHVFLDLHCILSFFWLFISVQTLSVSQNMSIKVSDIDHHRIIIKYATKIIIHKKWSKQSSTDHPIKNMIQSSLILLYTLFLVPNLTNNIVGTLIILSTTFFSHFLLSFFFLCPYFFLFSQSFFFLFFFVFWIFSLPFLNPPLFVFYFYPFLKKAGVGFWLMSTYLLTFLWKWHVFTCFISPLVFSRFIYHFFVTTYHFVVFGRLFSCIMFYLPKDSFFTLVFL